MKNNQPVTQKEVTFSANEQLISSTDTKGIIESCNDCFVRTSGFTKDELIGTNHNIVRHPDMPSEAFEDMWNALHAGKPWMGIVKNRSKTGDYYWVDAFVTPIFDGNEIVGYESVRVSPEKSDIERAEKLYNNINNGKKPPKGHGIPLHLELGGAMAIAGLVISSIAVLVGDVSWLMGVSAWAAWSLSSWLISWYFLAPLAEAAKRARKIIDNPLVQRLYTTKNGDGGAIITALRMQEARIRTILGRINFSTSDVKQAATTTAESANEMADEVSRQQHEVSMLATAMEEMSASVAEVAGNAGRVSESTRAANNSAQNGKNAVAEAVASTEAVADEVARAAETIRALEKDSESIDEVLVVIRGIAEQTNLLALNAAIEAARAGEQGRGFAVVADEVRTLASRTQASTEEIQSMIERLQTNARSAVNAMEQSNQRVDSSVASTQKVGSKLDEIFDMVASLDTMNLSIATAADQQHSVSEEIARNVHSISDASEHLSQAASDAASNSSNLAGLSQDLNNLVKRFSHQ